MKKGLIILTCLMVVIEASSQEYFHKLGAGFSGYGQKYAFTSAGLNSEGETGGAAPNIVYQAGLNFEIGNNLNIAPTAYPSIGFGAQVNSRGGSSYFFAFELPVLAELYLGDREEFGGFLGLGFSYSYYNIEDIYSSGSATVMGPQVSGGIHFNTDNIGFLSALIGDGGFTLRGSYTLPINSPDELEGVTYTVNEYTFNASLSILYDLGR